MKKIVLASTSAVKIYACRRAFGPEFEIVTVRVPSGVNEQPMEEETLQGANNRIVAARRAVPDADLYVAIENGVFDEGSAYVDRAIVVMEHRSGLKSQGVSDGVIFPDAAVEEARKRGLHKWTVGQIMQEQGLVASHDDPHLTLSGKRRAEYLYEAVRRAGQPPIQTLLNLANEGGFRPISEQEQDWLTVAARLVGISPRAALKDAPKDAPKVPHGLRVRCWISVVRKAVCAEEPAEQGVRHLRPRDADISVQSVAVPVVAYGDRAAYVLGLGVNERLEGYPHCCLLSAHPVDPAQAAPAVGEAVTEGQFWYWVEAYDFLAAQRDYRFLYDNKWTRVVDWAGVGELWSSIYETQAGDGLLGMYFCVDVTP